MWSMASASYRAPEERSRKVLYSDCAGIMPKGSGEVHLKQA